MRVNEQILTRNSTVSWNRWKTRSKIHITNFNPYFYAHSIKTTPQYTNTYKAETRECFSFPYFF